MFPVNTYNLLTLLQAYCIHKHTSTNYIYQHCFSYIQVQVIFSSNIIFLIFTIGNRLLIPVSRVRIPMACMLTMDVTALLTCVPVSLLC